MDDGWVDGQMDGGKEGRRMDVCTWWGYAIMMVGMLLAFARKVFFAKLFGG